MIELDGTALTSADIAAAARQTRTVGVTDRARRQVAASHAFAERISAGRPVYGRSTGVGANRNVEIADPAGHAIAMLRSHATAGGGLRSDERVRAMLVVRLNQLAAGGSGAALDVFEGLAAMVAADALPQVREYGSIGTGDLSALATVALTLLGELPNSRGSVLNTRFGAADALPFISSNAGVIGDAALAWSSLDLLARAYPVVAALTFLAIDGNSEAYAPVIEQVTPFAGARTVCRWMRELTGSARPPARIQDPFGIRAVPQAHGPAVDALRGLDEVIGRLANAPAENPVVLADATGSGQIAHHAGFHAAYLGLALDTTMIAVAQSAQLIQARLATLAEPAFTGQAPFLGDGIAGHSGMMVVEYVAASALGDIRASATPAGLNTVVISRGVEEDASFASLAARQAADGAQALRTLLACELVSAVRAIRLRTIWASNPLLARALAVCVGLSAQMADRDLTADIALAAGLLPVLAEVLASD